MFECLLSHIVFRIHNFPLFISSKLLAEEEQTREQELEERMEYYVKYSNPILPWYYLAAIDQFERNIQAVRSDIPKSEGPISIYFPSEFWNGALNPVYRRYVRNFHYVF